MTIETRLAEIKARADAATEGPWMVDPEDFGTILASNDGGFDGYHIADVHDHDGGMFPIEHNGQFIAHARTDLPTLLAAVEAVVKLHAPKPIYVLAEECEAPEDHEHGTTSDGGEDICWDEPTGEVHCSECRDEWGDPVDHPCPTVQAITAALEVQG